MRAHGVRALTASRGKRTCAHGVGALAASCGRRARAHGVRALTALRGKRTRAHGVRALAASCGRRVRVHTASGRSPLPRGHQEPKVSTPSDESGGPRALGMKPWEARAPVSSPQGHKTSRDCLPSLCDRGQ